MVSVCAGQINTMQLRYTDALERLQEVGVINGRRVFRALTLRHRRRSARPPRRELWASGKR